MRMIRRNVMQWMAPWALGVAALGCGDNNNQTPGIDAPVHIDAPPAVTDIDVTADITANTTWTKDITYHLKIKSGNIPYIMVNPGATLTIEAGTKIVGSTGSALVITRGAKIMAVGTAQNPIVFSHDAPVGQREPGKWGGLLLLGNAHNNLGNDQKFEAFPDGVTDPRFLFGGADDNDNSGVLKYVRIEFAGYSYRQNREFNGLTLCGVGKGTQIDFVQIHRGADDGIEFFGGTVDVKHIVSSQNDDDGFDTDNGWDGRAQFIIVQHVNGKSSDPNGYESDNCANCDSATTNLTPKTAPTVYNATLIGDKTAPVSGNASFGAVLRRDTTGKYFNQIFLSFRSSGALVPDAKTCASMPADLFVQSSIYFNNSSDATNFKWDLGATPDPAQAARDAACDEKVKIGDVASNKIVDPMLTNPYNLTAPNFKPMAGSPALDVANAAPPPNDGFFDASATFVGAIGATDWTTGWTSYPLN